MNRNRKGFLFWLMVALIAFYMLFPFWWAIISSLKSEAQLQMMPATLLPRNPETGAVEFYFLNYISVLKDKVFLRGLLNSTIVSFSTTLLALLIGSLAGFALGKLKFRGKTPSMYLILAMTMFPQICILSSLYAIINALQLPAMLSMVISYMLFCLPFTTWVLTAFFKELPHELLQSALVDGATPLQTFRKILLPLTAPALVTTGLLTFIGAWNEYLFALTFTTVEKSARTVPVAIALFSGSVSRQYPFGEIMAASIIVTIPIVALVLIFQKRIVAGLTSGAVKG